MISSLDLMSKYAKENFYESKEYARNTLVERRTNFFVEYKNAVEGLNE